MDRPLAVLGGFGLVAALHLAGAAHGAPPARRARQTVTVDVRCEGGRVASSSVGPDPVELVQGDSLDWVLGERANAQSFEIVPVDHPDGQPARAWPFSDDPALRRGRPGAPARAHAMRADAAGRYRYAVVARCGGGGGAGAEVTIDPDIIIRAQ